MLKISACPVVMNGCDVNQAKNLPVNPMIMDLCIMGGKKTITKTRKHEIFQDFFRTIVFSYVKISFFFSIKVDLRFVATG